MAGCVCLIIIIIIIIIDDKRDKHGKKRYICNLQYTHTCIKNTSLDDEMFWFFFCSLFHNFLPLVSIVRSIEFIFFFVRLFLAIDFLLLLLLLLLFVCLHRIILVYQSISRKSEKKTKQTFTPHDHRCRRRRRW